MCLFDSWSLWAYALSNCWRCNISSLKRERSIVWINFVTCQVSSLFHAARKASFCMAMQPKERLIYCLKLIFPVLHNQKGGIQQLHGQNFVIFWPPSPHLRFLIKGYTRLVNFGNFDTLPALIGAYLLTEFLKSV